MTAILGKGGGDGDGLKTRDILVKPPNDPRPGPDCMRITTALPSGNARFVPALEEILTS